MMRHMKATTDRTLFQFSLFPAAQCHSSTSATSSMQFTQCIQTDAAMKQLSYGGAYPYPQTSMLKLKCGGVSILSTFVCSFVLV